MQELARNTRNQTSHWDQGTRLRDQPVCFISGGFIEPSKELKGDTISTSDIANHAPRNSKNDNNKIAESPPSELSVLQSLSNINPDNPTFDGQQGKSVTESDSSGEIILFKGRGDRHKTRRGSKWRGPIRTATTSRPSYSSTRECLGNDNDEGTNAAMDDYISNVLLDDMQHTIQPSRVNNRELGGYDSGIVCTDPRQHVPNASVFKPEPNQASPLGTEDQFDEDENEDSDGETWGLSATMDDAQLARLLAKQEELGLGANEHILFDGDSMRGISGGKVGDRDFTTDPSTKKTSSHMRASKKGPRAVNGSYPSAEAVADAFERLDMSGWGGSRNGFEFNLSDSELEAQLRTSWQKDRQRKKEKKRAREELRAQGPLGKTAKPNDPRVKYPDGMHLDDIKSEFHGFLNGSENRQVCFRGKGQRNRSILGLETNQCYFLQYNVYPHGFPFSQDNPRAGTSL